MRAQRRKNRRERIRRMGVIDDDSAATLIRGDELQPAFIGRFAGFDRQANLL